MFLPLIVPVAPSDTEPLSGLCSLPRLFHDNDKASNPSVDLTSALLLYF